MENLEHFLCWIILISNFNYFSKNYAYGHILAIHEIAFTVPTRAGKQFIKKYTNKSDYFVYTGW